MDEKVAHSVQTKKNHGAPASNQLGTFGGVFTPSILTILGVIREPYTVDIIEAPTAGKNGRWFF